MEQFVSEEINVEFDKESNQFAFPVPGGFRVCTETQLEFKTLEYVSIRRMFQKEFLNDKEVDMEGTYAVEAAAGCGGACRPLHAH